MRIRVYNVLRMQKPIYYFWGKIGAKVAGFSVRNTFIYKFVSFARLYFPYFTQFRNQTGQFY